MCSICGKTPCKAACPNSTEIMVDVCESCGRGIFEGDEYYNILDKFAICEDCIDKYLTVAETEEETDMEW